MNAIKFITGMVALVMFLGCKSSIKPVTTLGGENTEASRTNDGNTASSNMDSDTMGSRDQNSVAEPMESTEVEEYNGSTGGNSNIQDAQMNADYSGQDFEQLFSDLEMTDDQIQQFNAAMEAYSNANATGTAEGDIRAEQDEIMENILNPEQLEKYEAWKQGH